MIAMIASIRVYEGVIDYMIGQYLERITLNHNDCGEYSASTVSTYTHAISTVTRCLIVHVIARPLGR